MPLPDDDVLSFSVKVSFDLEDVAIKALDEVVIVESDKLEPFTAGLEDLKVLAFALVLDAP
jgi:hypothetical protein